MKIKALLEDAAIDKNHQWLRDHLVGYDEQTFPAWGENVTFENGIAKPPNGILRLRFKNLNGELPFKFQFDSSLSASPSIHLRNCKITSLKNFPDGLDELYFTRCSIKSFDNFPTAASLHFDRCDMPSLKGIEKIKLIGSGLIEIYDTEIKSHILGVLLIPGFKRISTQYCDQAWAERRVRLIDAISTVDKYAGQGRSGLMKAQRELLDHDLDDYAEM